MPTSQAKYALCKIMSDSLLGKDSFRYRQCFQNSAVNLYSLSQPKHAKVVSELPFAHTCDKSEPKFRYSSGR